MTVSVIIPAFNEERYLGETLKRLNASIAAYGNRVEVIVVDNCSTDRTAAVAESLGATVAVESVHNVAAVRNRGARAAHGDILVFLDADTTVPQNFLTRIAESAAAPCCLGGSADVRHVVRSRLLRLYFACWRCLGLALGMAQGAAQFCKRPAFDRLGGYDATLFMGEDVDFYWRLKRLAAREGCRVVFLSDVRVMPSPRRFDQWPLWRTLLWTNPLFIAPLRKVPSVWGAWYRNPPR